MRSKLPEQRQKINTAKVCCVGDLNPFGADLAPAHSSLSARSLLCLLWASVVLRSFRRTSTELTNSFSRRAHFIGVLVCLTYISFICSLNCAAGSSSPDVDTLGGRDFALSIKPTRLRVQLSKRLSVASYQHNEATWTLRDLMMAPETSTTTPNSISVTTMQWRVIKMHLQMP